MNNKLFIFFIFLILYNFNHSISQPRSIEIKLSLNKKEFLEGEPIYLYIKFHNPNNSKDSLNIDGPNLPNYIHVSNNEGKEAERFNFIVDYIGSHYLVVNPRDSIVLNYALMSFMGFAETGCTGPEESFYFPVGNYSVGYNNKSIDFKIVEPSGDVIQIIKKILETKRILTYDKNKVYPNRYQPDSVKKKIENYYKIYTNYPTSVFVKYSFYMFFHYYWELNYSVDSSTFELAYDFIRKFPNCYYVNYIIFYMCRGLGSRVNEEAVDFFLDDLIGNLPKTKTQKIAKELILSRDYSK